MSNPTESANARYTTQYFPQHVALLTVGKNIMPIGHWTVISKDPFRLLLAMEMGNHSYTLLQKYREAAFHFMPWNERYKVARAGFISGRDFDKAEELGFELLTAKKLQNTRLVAGADGIFEMVVFKELDGLSREFAIYVFDIIATHGKYRPVDRQPILYLSLKDFATLSETWKYQK